MQKRKSLSPKVREAVYYKYDGHCAYCGKELTYKEFQVDHLIPVQRERFGRYTEEQLEKTKAQANLITYFSMIYPNAAKAMKHFLNGTGENFELDVENFLKNSIAKENMLSDVNKALRAVEVMSTDDESITVYQIEESLHHNLVDDWKFTLGSYFTSIEMYDVEQKTLLGVTYYTAKLKYIVQDFYNWDKNDTNNVSILKVSPADLHQLHVNGEAKEFLTYEEDK